MMKKFLVYLVALLLFIIPAEAEITALSELNESGMIVGVSQGSAADQIVREQLPKASIAYFTDNASAYLAVIQGKADAYVYDHTQMRLAIEGGVDYVKLLDETMGEPVSIAVAISPVSRIPLLEEKLNSFIGELRADGTLDDMFWRWVMDGTETMPDIAVPEHAEMHLSVGTSGIVPPYSYYAGTELNGYDIELARRFAAWLGADLEIKVYDYGAIIPAAISGDVDCIMSDLNATPERREALHFSDILFEERLGVMVRAETETEETISSSAPAAPDAASAAVQKTEQPATVPPGVFTSLSQMNGKRIGVQTGTSFDQAVFAQFPDAEVSYFNTKADLISALLTYKVDGYTVDEPVAKVEMQQEDRLTYIPEYMERFEFAYVFPKTDEGQALCDQFSEYLRTIRADGTMAEIEEKWFSEDESQKTIIDWTALPAANGTLKMATEALYEPFTYIKNNQITGYDIDITARFCQAYGYGLEIVDMSFDAVLPAVQSGKCDFGGSGITITKERAESVLFSEPNFMGGTVMAVLKAEEASPAAAPETQTKESFWDGLKSSFDKTFIREDRWKLFLEGIWTTLLITLLSTLFGTALGFLVFMLCRNGNLIANGVTRFSVWLITGTPMVVLLMILYYIIFGSVAIGGITVAVIGFTLTFGASVFGLIRMGVGTIDRGQYEAAYALGHSNRHTFFKIILPQAIPHVLPAYQGEIVGLIKATAIVGYIAVQDLTKMGDIVRSRTYEAFFPLIAVTVIYFVLEVLLSFAVSRIRISIDPKKRKRESILKGVDLHDQN